MVPIGLIKPSEKNPRIIPDEAVEQLARSIREFGFLVPCVIDEDFILLAGHTRLLAALERGMYEVPCVQASDLTEAQKDRFRLADNKLSELTSWNETELYGILTGLGDLPPGFWDDDLEELRQLTDTGDGDPPPEDPGGGNPDPESPGDLIPITFRVRRCKFAEAKKLCEEALDGLGE